MIYLTEQFTQREAGRLHALIETHPFATLVSTTDGSAFVSHVPLRLDRDRGERGTLLGHLSRENPHWKLLAEATQALAIFHGPHAYVSPAWYSVHPSVPTWNYAVVHASGPVHLIEDPQRVWALLLDLVRAHESPRADRWTPDLPADYLQRMVAGVVAFELRIERLEGKFKLSQNRPESDRTRVAAALEADGSQIGAELAALMRSVAL